jgi:hypothetical protein
MSRMTTFAFLALVLMVGFAAAARASLIVTTPAGVAPGGSFIVAFVDTTIGHATSTSISTYDASITTAAANITYSGGTIGTWQVLGATASSDPAASAFSSLFPVYDDKGDLLGTSGSEWQTAGYTPRFDQTGTAANGRPTWTGLGQNGAPASGDQLGQTNVTYGYPEPTPAYMPLGGLDSGTTAGSGFGDLYGFAIFTAAEPVPEPATITLSLAGIVAVAAVGWAQRRRRPVSVTVKSL